MTDHIPEKRTPHKDLVIVEWLATYRYKGDKLNMKHFVRNNCQTFKQLRRWWRVNNPKLKLISAIKK